MTKNIISDEWENYINRQISRKVSLKKIEDLMIRNNYSKEIINKLLYNTKLNIIDNISKKTNKNILSLNPLIYTIENFIDSEKCNHFITLSKNKLKPSLVTYDDKGIESKGRTSINCWISHKHDDLVFSVANKISQLLNIPLENAESYQVIYYDINGKYRNHYDGWLFDNSDKSNRCLKNGGQRMITALCYLNDVIEGGETKFTKLNIKIDPSPGKLLVFKNVYNQTNIRHNLSEHSGMPVIKGEKYAYNLWFREYKVN